MAIAIGLASGAFSFLNGGDLLGTGMAVVAGGFGQALRALLFRRRRNQYAVTALSAVVTASLYCAGIASLGATGFGPGHAAGFIFSVLSWFRASRSWRRCSTPSSISRWRR